MKHNDKNKKNVYKKNNNNMQSNNKTQNNNMKANNRQDANTKTNNKQDANTKAEHNKSDFSGKPADRQRTNRDMNANEKGRNRRDGRDFRRRGNTGTMKDVNDFAVETAQDIKKDIYRIEKEIILEIQTIRTMKL